MHVAQRLGLSALRDGALQALERLLARRPVSLLREHQDPLRSRARRAGLLGGLLPTGRNLVPSTPTAPSAITATPGVTATRGASIAAVFATDLGRRKSKPSRGPMIRGMNVKVAAAK